MVGSSSSRMSGRRSQDSNERYAPRLFAARELGRLRGEVHSKLSHHGARGVAGIVIREARKHVIERRREPGDVRLLRQIGEPRRGLHEARSAVRNHLSRRDPQQRRLARAVAADEGDAVARRNRQLRPCRAAARRRASERCLAIAERAAFKTRISASMMISADDPRGAPAHPVYRRLPSSIGSIWRTRDRRPADHKRQRLPRVASRRRVASASQRRVSTRQTRGDKTLLRTRVHDMQSRAT